MLLPLFSSTAFASFVRRFRRNRRGSAAVEFALVAPIFFDLLFALFETALVFFAGQVLENGVQDSGRLIYTYQAQKASMSQSAFKTDLCNRVSVLLTCDGVTVDVQSYPPGATIPTAPPYDSAGAAIATMAWNPPAPGSTNTVVIRAFYQWPLIVTQLGYNIANINRDSPGSAKRLLVGTAAFRVEPQ